jgi:hypothetical protein
MDEGDITSLTGTLVVQIPCAEYLLAQSQLKSMIIRISLRGCVSEVQK